MGIQLDYDESGMDTISPLNCLVIVEGMNSDGTLSHVVIPSEGLGNIKAAGMLAFANEWIQWNLRIQLLNGIPGEGTPGDSES
jgi:hypothetical protein